MMNIETGLIARFEGTRLPAVTLPAIGCQPTPNTPGRRTLALSGTWTAFGDWFRLEATIAIAPDGAACGLIWWRATRGTSIAGHEEVGGQVLASTVEIRGVSADPGLACDQYRISLLGDDHRGSFTGSSWAFGSWQGQLSGTYVFSDDTSPTS
jgi:hypothetical protein